MLEAVRLVVWDLDDTFWRGTVTEGGIAEYVQEHHDIIIELANRGIMSSVCSKNDEATILEILREKNILDYIIFPSISWESKGARLASLVEVVQLRPETVMFIDDNPGNRAEASAMVPGLQVESELFISQILSDRRFKGKDDKSLSRLAQYKLLETRKKDEVNASGNNEEFLRGCNIRVYIEYNVQDNLDRAIELINRTNQLNFTKKRLPEDVDLARDELRKEISARTRQSGLVRVVDRYGDYGFVGFFLVENGAVNTEDGRLSQTLLHYCFSCRTLGMLVEQWLYERLQRPKIKVVGEVLTDLQSVRTIDWITMVQSLDDGALPTPKLAPEIRIHGGCEATSIAHYLGGYSDQVVITGNFFAGAYFVRTNGASLLLSACDRATPEFEVEAEALHIPYKMLVSDYLSDAPTGTVFVFGGQWDTPGGNRYRHKVHGWEIRVEQNNLGNVDVVAITDDELAQKLADLNTAPEKRELISAVSWHLHNNYESLRHPDEGSLAASMTRIFDRIPSGSKLVIILDHDHVRGSDGVVRFAPWVKKYVDQIISIVAPYPFVTTISFSDFIQSEEEIHIGGNHYDRMVYYRMAAGIASAAQELMPKSEPIAQSAAA